jgi:hypothetical protein
MARTTTGIMTLLAAQAGIDCTDSPAENQVSSKAIRVSTYSCCSHVEEEYPDALERLWTAHKTKQPNRSSTGPSKPTVDAFAVVVSR